MNLFAYPDTVDFFGPAGASFKRQGQVRLTYHDGPWLFAVAAENPETDLTHWHNTAACRSASTCAESLGTNICER